MSRSHIAGQPQAQPQSLSQSQLAHQTAPESDVIVVGAGPAGLSLVAELATVGLNVTGIAPHLPDHPWPNTYGIWEDELVPLALTHLLAHCWQDCVSYFYDGSGQAQEVPHHRVYALFDNQALQHHLLAKAERGAGRVTWQQGYAVQANHDATGATVTLRSGETARGRVVIDAGGHHAALLNRQPAPITAATGKEDPTHDAAPGHPVSANLTRQTATQPIAYQTAYGVVGRFSAPPVRTDQLVLMDYRADHLDEQARRHEPPTFLYAMHLGGDRYFVEETCLAHAPAVALSRLEARLHRRLARRGIEIVATEHIERCFFPMNLPIPDLHQPIVGFGSAAAMVHPASGYQVGSALHRAPTVADALAAGLGTPGGEPARAAAAAWRAVWPRNRLRRHQLYRFGLQNVLTFDEAQLHAFFMTFFGLPSWMWRGYLSNTLSTVHLMQTMLTLFGRAPRRVQRQLAASVGSQATLLRRALLGQP